MRRGMLPRPKAQAPPDRESTGRGESVAPVARIAQAVSHLELHGVEQHASRNEGREHGDVGDHQHRHGRRGIGIDV